LTRATAGVLVAALLAPSTARADAASCVAASDLGQKLRDDGHLVASRAQFATCAQESCPTPVRGDCVRWLEDVDRRLPTIVIAATAGGRDTSDVRVSIDGALVKSRLDGGAIPLDPGEHRIRYEHAGDPPVQDTFVLREGEKDRALRVRFGASPEAKILAPVPARPPVLGYAMVGVAAAGLVSFAVLAIAGYSTIQVCKSEPNCDVPSHSSQTATEFAFADVSLGIGLVAAGIATWAFLHHAHARAQGVGFDPARAAFVF